MSDQPIKRMMPSRAELNIMKDIANNVVRSGISGCNTAQEAFAKILTGWSMGLDVATSLNNIKPVEGRMALPELVKVAAVRQSGIGDVRTVERTETKATVAVTRKDWPEGRTEHVSFTIEDAVRGGLVNLDAKGVNVSRKDNWRKWVCDMLLARARGTALRVWLEEASAGLPYSPEELGADTDEDGNPVELDTLYQGTAPAAPAAPVALPKLKPLQPAAVDAPPSPSPAPALSDVPAMVAAVTACLPQNTPAPVDHFADGLAAMDRRMVSEEQQLKARGLLTLLRFDMPTWKSFLKYHFGVETMKAMEETPANACIAHLDRLHRLELIRREAGVDDANLARALSKRGCKEFWQLSPEHAQEMISKMLPGISPFRLQQLGLAGFQEPIGGIGGNGSTPTAGANPPAMGPDALPQNQDLAPSITAPSLIPQAA